MTTKNMRTLYHVTWKGNCISIQELGISPQFCRATKRGVYLVDYQRVPWAIIHVADRDESHIADLIIYKCVVHKTAVERMPTEGLFMHRTVIIPASVQTFYGWWVGYCDHLGHEFEANEQARRLHAAQTRDVDFGDIPF